MSTTKFNLGIVKVASPCTASWDEMSGDNTARFCGQCSQFVYNLSEMSQDAAEALISEHEGKMCVRFYRRSDGTVMTKDCPVGWRALKRRMAIVGGVATTFVVAAFSLLTLGVFAASVRGNGNGGLRLVNPIARVMDWMFPPEVAGGGQPPVVINPLGVNDPPNMIMGGICPPNINENLPPGPIPAPEEIAVPLPELKK